VVEDWSRSGGFEVMLKRAQAAGRQILAGFDPSDLLETYEGLPGGVQAAVLQELALPRPAWLSPASDALVRAFGSTAEGKQLVAEWGSRAAANIATIRARMESVIERMSDADATEFNLWLDRVPSREWQSLMRGLVR
jgi:hypothetical protein